MRKVVPLPLAVLLSTVAFGWLYLTGPALPGPRIAEALPLDELSRHDAASLLWFALVWGATGVVIFSHESLRPTDLDRLRQGAFPPAAASRRDALATGGERQR